MLARALDLMKVSFQAGTHFLMVVKIVASSRRVLWGPGRYGRYRLSSVMRRLKSCRFMLAGFLALVRNSRRSSAVSAVAPHLEMKSFIVLVNRLFVGLS